MLDRTDRAKQVAEMRSALHLQITRANFKESLPVIKQALADCQYFAFDCEMTGLTTQDSKQEYLDEVEDRYAQARVACMHRRYAPGQLKQP